MLGWGYLEADFARFYGIDVTADCASGAMSWRRLLALTAGLPGDALFRYFRKRGTPLRPLDGAAGEALFASMVR